MRLSVSAIPISDNDALTETIIISRRVTKPTIDTSTTNFSLSISNATVATALLITQIQKLPTPYD